LPKHLQDFYAFQAFEALENLISFGAVVLGSFRIYANWYGEPRVG